MFKIGEFSKLSMLSVRMLRHYDAQGLLTPEQVDAFTGYRYYGADQLARADRIRVLRDLGFGVAAIGEILARYDDPETLKNYLTVRLREMQGEFSELGARLHSLETTIERLGKDGTAMNYAVNVKEIPEMQAACLRDVIHAYEQEGELWQRLYGALAGKNVQFASPAYTMAVFYDEGFKEQDVDVEIRAAVEGVYPDAGEVHFRKIPAVTVASAVMKGSYDQVSAVCGAIGEWIEQNGYRMNGPMFNIYHVSPGMDPGHPENWVTEICFPVEKA